VSLLVQPTVAVEPPIGPRRQGERQRHDAGMYAGVAGVKTALGTRAPLACPKARTSAGRSTF